LKQQNFETERAPSWAYFEQVLSALDQGDRERAAEFPTLYRQLCQDLALARDRVFTEELVARLNALALRGHEHMYRSRGLSYAAIFEFLLRGFPRAVRNEARIFSLFLVLFFGGVVFCAYAVQVWPDITHRLLGSDAMSTLESSFGGERERSASQDAQMFGFYIFNNVSIGFRTFACGIFFGIGSLLILLVNALHIGLAAGYVIENGWQQSFFSFVSGHSSLELVAIVLAAVAGMRLGLALIAPGRHTRRNAVSLAASHALPIVYGASAMLVLAALIEGFWSASNFAPVVHYAVGFATWTGVAAYFVLAGRRGDSSEAEAPAHAA